MRRSLAEFPSVADGGDGRPPRAGDRPAGVSAPEASAIRSGRVRGVVVALLLAGSCRAPAPATSGASAQDVLDALIAADNAGDVRAIASCYAEDAVLLPPNAPPVVGREEIAGRYEAGFGRFRLRVALRQDRLRASDSVAFSHGITEGEFVWLDGSPPTSFHDAYLMTLTRDPAGNWRVAALMWSPLEETE